MSRRLPPRLPGNARTTDTPRGRPILLLALLIIPTQSYPQSVLLADGISSKAFEGALAPFPSAEKLSYDIEWRLIYAGSALLSLAPKPGDPRKWDSELHIESGG